MDILHVPSLCHVTKRGLSTDPLPPRMGNLDILHEPSFCHVTKYGLSTDPLPPTPLLVHVVIECPPIRRPGKTQQV